MIRLGKLFEGFSANDQSGLSRSDKVRMKLHIPAKVAMIGGVKYALKIAGAVISNAVSDQGRRMSGQSIKLEAAEENTVKGVGPRVQPLTLPVILTGLGSRRPIPADIIKICDNLQRGIKSFPDSAFDDEPRLAEVITSLCYLPALTHILDEVSDDCNFNTAILLDRYVSSEINIVTSPFVVITQSFVHFLPNPLIGCYVNKLVLRTPTLLIETQGQGEAEGIRLAIDALNALTARGITIECASIVIVSAQAKESQTIGHLKTLMLGLTSRAGAQSMFFQAVGGDDVRTWCYLRKEDSSMALFTDSLDGNADRKDYDRFSHASSNWYGSTKPEPAS